MLRAFRVIYPSVASLCAVEGSLGLCRLLPCRDAEDAAEVGAANSQAAGIILCGHLFQSFSVFPPDHKLPISRLQFFPTSFTIA